LAYASAIVEGGLRLLTRGIRSGDTPAGLERAARFLRGGISKYADRRDNG
jgi:hypothetical protein